VVYTRYKALLQLTPTPQKASVSITGKVKHLYSRTSLQPNIFAAEHLCSKTSLQSNTFAAESLYSRKSFHAPSYKRRHFAFSISKTRKTAIFCCL